MQNPKMEHAKALRETRVLKPCGDKDMEIYVDANFSDNWDSDETWDGYTA
jgi:hypothetical protein